MEIREVYKKILGMGELPQILITDGLLFKSNGNTKLTLNDVGSAYGGTMKYSKNSTAWKDYTFGTQIELANDEEVVFSGNSHVFTNSATQNKYLQFATQGPGFLAVSGNLSALYGDRAEIDFDPETTNGTYFKNLFSGCIYLGDASNLNTNYTSVGPSGYAYMFYKCLYLSAVPSNFLPATVLKTQCYDHMFGSCTYLSTAPVLSATAVASGCYMRMFAGSRISAAPLLPATTLAARCYEGMFAGCNYISSLPTGYLSATELAPNCYNEMFHNCTSLSTVPNLPATTLADSCYYQMFTQCSKIQSIGNQLTGVLEVANSCCAGMFASSNVKSIGRATFAKVRNLETSCYLRMFYNTQLTGVNEDFFENVREVASKCCYRTFSDCKMLLSTAPFPNVSKTADRCYLEMFAGCTRLTGVPALYSQQLAPSCYQEMFSACTSLTSLTAYFPNWFDSVNETPPLTSIPTSRIVGYATPSGTVPTTIPLTFISHGKTKIRLRRKEGPLYNESDHTLAEEPLSGVVIQYNKNNTGWVNYKNTAGVAAMSTGVWNQIPTGEIIELDNNDTLAFRNTSDYWGGGILYFESPINNNDSIVENSGYLEVIGNIRSLIGNATGLKANVGTHSHSRHCDNFAFLFTGIERLQARYLQLLPGTTYNGNRKTLAQLSTGGSPIYYWGDTSANCYSVMFEERQQLRTFTPSANVPIFDASAASANAENIQYYYDITGYVDGSHLSSNTPKHTIDWTSGITTVGIFYKTNALHPIWNSEGTSITRYMPFGTGIGQYSNLARYFIDANGVSAQYETPTVSSWIGSHFIPSAWILGEIPTPPPEPIDEDGHTVGPNYVINGIDVVPLFKSGKFHHNGQHGNADLTYTYNDSTSMVGIEDNDHTTWYNYLIPSNGAMVTRNNMGSYYFMPQLTYPLTICATDPTKPFRVNLWSKVSTHKKWVIRTVDEIGSMWSCNGVPLSAGVTLSSKNRDTGETKTSAFNYASMPYIPIYTSATIDGVVTSITRTMPGEVQAGFVRWDMIRLKAGDNIFRVPKSGYIQFWNMTDKCNAPGGDGPNYQFRRLGDATLMIYGDFNSIRDHKFYRYGDPFQYMARNDELQAGAFKDLFSGHTSLGVVTSQILPLSTVNTSLPAYYCANMFKGCTALTTTVPIKTFLGTIGKYAFNNMFSGCTSLTGFDYSNAVGVSNIYINNIEDYGCASMFNYCTGMVSSNLYIYHGTKGIGSFKNMYKNCWNIGSNYNNNITINCQNLQPEVFQSMFEKCLGMKNMPTFNPSINESNVPASAYTYMFCDCHNLTGGYGLNTFFTTVLDNGVTAMDGSFEATFADCSSLVFPSITLDEIGEIDTNETGYGYPDYVALASETSNVTNNFTVPYDGWIRFSRRDGATEGSGRGAGNGPSSGIETITIDGKTISLFEYNAGQTTKLTHLLPVKAGMKISPSLMMSGCVRYAPALTGCGNICYPDWSAMSNTSYVGWTLGSEYQPPSNGWLRISVINPTTDHHNGCLRIHMTDLNSNMDTVGMPLYGYWGNGTTFIIPVTSYRRYKIEGLVESDGKNKTIITFTPSFTPTAKGFVGFPNYTLAMGYHFATNVLRDKPLTANWNGWIRVWVGDNGVSNGCMRFTINGTTWSEGQGWSSTAIPLYQHATSGNGIAYFLPIKAGDVFEYGCSLNYSTDTTNCRVWYLPNLGAYTTTLKKVMLDDLIYSLLNMSFYNSSTNAFWNMFMGCSGLTYSPVLNIVNNGTCDYHWIFTGNENMRYIFVGEGINTVSQLTGILPSNVTGDKYIFVPANWSGMPASRSYGQWKFVEYMDLNGYD